MRANPSLGSELGLYFHSHEKNKDNRTSLDLTYDRPIEFNGYFCLEFDLLLRPAERQFGYVYDIEMSRENSLKLLSNKGVLQILYNKTLLAEYKNRKEGLDLSQWNHFKTEITEQNGYLTIYSNGHKIADSLPLPDNDRFKIIFGARHNPQKSVYDVPPIILKEVSIGISPETVRYYWPLSSHYGSEIVYDQYRKKPAKVLNPNWIIDRHVKWKKEGEFRFDSKVLIAPGGDSELLVVSRKNISRYDLSRISEEPRLYEFDTELDIAYLVHQFIYDPFADELVLYDFDDGGVRLARFDLKTGYWLDSFRKNKEHTYLHHNCIFNTSDSTIIQLFGYGFHLYRSEMNVAHPDGASSRVDLSEWIDPRYLAGAGMQDSLIYVYGGVGNKSGRQEQGTTIFHDLYTIDPRSAHVAKLWTGDRFSDMQVPAGRMINTSHGKFQTLFFNPSLYSSCLQLREIDVAGQTMTPLADSIPYAFHDIHSHAELIVDRASEKMFAVTLHKDYDNDGFTVNVYSVKTPVLSPDRAVLAPPVGGKKYFIPVIAAIVCLICAVILLIRKKRNLSLSGEIPLGNLDDEFKQTYSKDLRPRRTEPGIYLLGGFQVIDRNGKDITDKFSPMTKELLLLIIIYSSRNDRGISNIRLKEFLWFDKNEKSIRNNRNVNIRKIRILLESVGNYSLTTNNDYWKITYDDPSAFCDLASYRDYLKNTLPETALTNDGLAKIISIAYAGRLLPETEYEWLDEHKEDYSNRIIHILSGLITRREFADDHKTRIMISDGILTFDSLDEDSVRIKCRSLVSSGRVGMAKSTFDAFVKEYEAVMGEQFAVKFEQFIAEPA